MPNGITLDKKGHLKSRTAMSDTMLLLTITVVVFFVMYFSAVLFWVAALQKPRTF